MLLFSNRPYCVQSRTCRTTEGNAATVLSWPATKLFGFSLQSITHSYTSVSSKLCQQAEHKHCLYETFSAYTSNPGNITVCVTHVKKFSITFHNVTTVAKSHYTIAEPNNEASEQSKQNVSIMMQDARTACVHTHAHLAEIKIADLKSVPILQCPCVKKKLVLCYVGGKAHTNTHKHTHRIITAKLLKACVLFLNFSGRATMQPV